MRLRLDSPRSRVPSADLTYCQVAAHAMETGADLVSAGRNFEHVDGIAWVRLRAERGPARPPL